MTTPNQSEVKLMTNTLETLAERLRRFLARIYIDTSPEADGDGAQISLRARAQKKDEPR